MNTGKIGTVPYFRMSTGKIGTVPYFLSVRVRRDAYRGETVTVTNSCSKPRILIQLRDGYSRR
jgi:hypothetical protein